MALIDRTHVLGTKIKTPTVISISALLIVTVLHLPPSTSLAAPPTGGAVVAALPLRVAAFFPVYVVVVVDVAAVLATMFVNVAVVIGAAVRVFATIGASITPPAPVTAAAIVVAATAVAVVIMMVVVVAAAACEAVTNVGHGTNIATRVLALLLLSLYDSYQETWAGVANSIC